MEKYFDINESGFSIRCKLYYNKDLHNLPHIVVATYGFGGNKDNKAVEKFAERLTTKYHGYGIVCFDWPCHGKDARNKLILDECCTYLDLVTRYVRDTMHAEDVYNYSSSFGAYITLRYLAEKQYRAAANADDHHAASASSTAKHGSDGQSEHHYLTENGDNPFKRIAFRCPAIKMYDSIAAGVTPEDWDKLRKGKEILRGFDRKIKLTEDFFDDLRAHDVSSCDFMDYAESILMIHGTKDEMAPIEVSRKFSDDNVIELVEVENADHPFSNPGCMDLAIQKIIEFFAPAEK